MPCARTGWPAVGRRDDAPSHPVHPGSPEDPASRRDTAPGGLGRAPSHCQTAVGTAGRQTARAGRWVLYAGSARATIGVPEVSAPVPCSMRERCQKTVLVRYQMRRCVHWAVRDGFCGRHHPDRLAARNARIAAKVGATMKRHRDAAATAQLLNVIPDVLTFLHHIDKVVAHEDIDFAQCKSLIKRIEKNTI